MNLHPYERTKSYRPEAHPETDEFPEEELGPIAEVLQSFEQQEILEQLLIIKSDLESLNDAYEIKKTSLTERAKRAWEIIRGLDHKEVEIQQLLIKIDSALSGNVSTQEMLSLKQQALALQQEGNRSELRSTSQSAISPWRRNPLLRRVVSLSVLLSLSAESQLGESAVAKENNVEATSMDPEQKTVDQLENTFLEQVHKKFPELRDTQISDSTQFILLAPNYVNMETLAAMLTSSPENSEPPAKALGEVFNSIDEVKFAQGVYFGYGKVAEKPPSMAIPGVVTVGVQIPGLVDGIPGNVIGYTPSKLRHETLTRFMDLTQPEIHQLYTVAGDSPDQKSLTRTLGELYNQQLKVFARSEMLATVLDSEAIDSQDLAVAFQPTGKTYFAEYLKDLQQLVKTTEETSVIFPQIKSETMNAKIIAALDNLDHHLDQDDDMEDSLKKQARESLQKIRQQFTPPSKLAANI